MLWTVLAIAILLTWLCALLRPEFLGAAVGRCVVGVWYLGAALSLLLAIGVGVGLAFAVVAALVSILL